jgi:hypothetical protein
MELAELLITPEARFNKEPNLTKMMGEPGIKQDHDYYNRSTM